MWTSLASCSCAECKLDQMFHGSWDSRKKRGEEVKTIAIAERKLPSFLDTHLMASLGIFLIVHSTLLQYIYEPAVPGGGSCCSIWQTSRPELLGVKWCPRIIAKKLAALGLPWCSAGEKSACNAGNPGLIARSGRFPGEGISYPLQYSWAFLVTQMVKNLPAMQET